MTVHQVLPTWEPGAIGAHALAVARALDAERIDNAVWADDVRGGLPPIAQPVGGLLAQAPRPGDVVVFHTAMATATADALLQRTEPLVVDHHNVTPPAFFDGWEPALAENLELAELQVARLARHATLGLADSEFNRADLVRARCRATAVAPLVVTPPACADANAAAPQGAPPGGAVWLFVGRIAPNKAQHDVVRAFAWYRRAHDPRALLRLVGGAPFDGYAGAVQRVAERLGVAGAVQLTGGVTDDELAAHYAAADVYVSCSRHEGFGAPLVEAMAVGVPVVAVAAGAVGETLGGAGLLVEHADPALVATAAHRAISDATVRAAAVAAGRARARQLAPARTAAGFVDALRPVVSAA
jgi:glycosyltransferase involved in cell wall biosynthesis